MSCWSVIWLWFKQTRAVCVWLEYHLSWRLRGCWWRSGSSMSSCQRLESCPSSIGSSWIPGLLQRQERIQTKTSCHPVSFSSRRDEQARLILHISLTFATFTPQPWVTRCDSWALVQNLVQCLAVQLNLTS